MKKTIFALALAMLTFAATASRAQAAADPCVAVTTASDTIFSGRPFQVSWKLPAQVPVSTTDPTLVPAKYDGFLLALDGAIGAARFEPIPKPISKICPDGNLGFVTTFPTGVLKGSHSMVTLAYLIQADGTRLEGVPTTRPFAAVDPVPTGQPPAPSNVGISR